MLTKIRQISHKYAKIWPWTGIGSTTLLHRQKIVENVCTRIYISIKGNRFFSHQHIFVSLPHSSTHFHLIFSFGFSHGRMCVYAIQNFGDSSICKSVRWKRKGNKKFLNIFGSFNFHWSHNKIYIIPLVRWQSNAIYWLRILWISKRFSNWHSFDSDNRMVPTLKHIHRKRNRETETRLANESEFF